ncbi:TPA: deoxyhypusine synthase [archaeon]|uniref:Deoxyhypusine synthase n=1 Tax=Candidatus Naiadarchaeum limnaeum TaxID=2756139 RepID=A0A832V2M3_9ARCH|nr:deoxyhypusine synthase [Candidatus Naiadarchaeum limnaeum]
MNEFSSKRKVKAIEVHNPKTISQLLSEMTLTGFQGRKLGEVVNVWEDMLKDEDITIFMGYAGSLSITGQWKMVKWLIEKRFIDVLVPTGANISEDIVEAMGMNYIQGTHRANDEDLFKQGYNRYYDIYGNEADYLKMTELIADFILTLEKDYRYSSKEFLYLFGKWLGKKKIDSIIATAAEHKVPIFCPAIVDSPYGDAALIARSRGYNLVLDSVKDYVEFMSLGEKVKDTGVIYIGGGVPKDFIQLFAATADLLYKDKRIPGREKGRVRKGTTETYYPHKYAIQITTDSPQWGGLSGCTFEEAVSWGKEAPEGKLVQCYSDATIALPLVVHALNERVKEKRTGTDFGSIFK